MSGLFYVYTPMKDIGLAILRLGFSLSMLSHGWGKLMKIANGDHGFADPIGLGEFPSLILATFAEFLCSILVAIGYKSRWAAIPLMITMSVAAFITHFDDAWGKKEKAFIYLIGFTVIFFTGAGKYSIDRK